MTKISVILLILILVVSTTLTKNSTKKIDYHIYETKENIRILRNKYEYVLLDYNYLSSPKKLMDFQSQYFENYLIPRKIDQINEISLDETPSIKILDNNLNE